MTETDSRWLVCHTKPRCEKKFAALLASANMEHYLPLIENRRRYASGEKRVFTKPLFPSYVFARVPVATQKRIYEQQLLVRTLPVSDERLLLRQLDQVKHVLASGVGLTLQPLLGKGREVRVVAGPLMGVTGIVFENSNADELVIKVDVLQQGVLVKIAPDFLEPIV